MAVKSKNEKNAQPDSFQEILFTFQLTDDIAATAFPHGN